MNENKKYYWIQITENCNVGLAGTNLDIRIWVPDGLTKEQIDEFENEMDDAMNEYGEENNGDYAEMDYHTIVKQAAEKLHIKYQYPETDYTIYL